MDEEGHSHFLLGSIIGNLITGEELKNEDDFIVTNNGVKRRFQTSKGYHINILWKDCSKKWINMNYVKESFPIQFAEYSRENELSDEKEFKWWDPFTIKKIQRILYKLKVKFWDTTKNYGIIIPRKVKEYLLIDVDNSNNMW